MYCFTFFHSYKCPAWQWSEKRLLATCETSQRNLVHFVASKVRLVEHWNLPDQPKDALLGKKGLVADLVCVFSRFKISYSTMIPVVTFDRPTQDCWNHRLKTTLSRLHWRMLVQGPLGHKYKYRLMNQNQF